MKKINQDIKKSELLPYYLLKGNEEYLINQFKKKFLDYFNNNKFNIKKFNNENITDVDYVIDAVNTSPLMLDKKLIIFENTSFLKNKISEELFNAIRDRQNINVYLFIENDVTTSNKLYNEIKNNGYICSLDTQNEEMLSKWLKNYFNTNNSLIEDSTIKYLLNTTGFSMEVLKNEADKLINYANGRIITNEDIDNICYKNNQSVIYDITNYLNKNNLKQAFNTYKKYILNNPQDLTKSNTYLFNLFKNNYSQIIICKELLEQSETKKTIANTLHISEGQAYYVIENCKQHDYEYFYNKYLKIIKLDKNIKNGSISIDNAIIELLTK